MISAKLVIQGIEKKLIKWGEGAKNRTAPVSWKIVKYVNLLIKTILKVLNFVVPNFGIGKKKNILQYLILRFGDWKTFHGYLVLQFK